MFRTTYVASLALISVAFTATLSDAEPSDSFEHWRPSWKKGDTWEVRMLVPVAQDTDTGMRVAYLAGDRYFRFEVLGERVIKFFGEHNEPNVLCFEVLCKEFCVLPNGSEGQVQTPRDYLVYYCKDTYVLIAVHSVSYSERGLAPDLSRLRKSDYFGDSFISNEGLYEDVPFLMPDWSKQTIVSSEWAGYYVPHRKDNKLHVPIRSDTVGASWFSQNLTEGADSRGKFVECSFTENFTIPEDTARKNAIDVAKLVLRWRPGEPWWRLAQRYDDGRETLRGELIRIGGKPVEAELPPVLESYTGEIPEDMWEPYP